MGDTVYINGEMVSRRDARISPFDRGFLYGYGIFETMRSYNGHVFCLDRHLSRLMRSAEQLDISKALHPTGLERAVYDTLGANRLSDARIRLTVSAGEGERMISHPDSASPTIIIFAEELKLPPEKAYEEGIHAVMVTTTRNRCSTLSRTKSLCYLDSLIARSEAITAGADEAILLNDEGAVAECSASNIFLVIGGKLVTPSPDSGILQGVTRDVVLELASGMSIVTEEREVPAGELLVADEAFLTNSIVEILPISKIDGRVVGSGEAGEISKRLLSAYRQLAARETRD
jgi:branched-chain amino acid aminotransferase